LVREAVTRTNLTEEATRNLKEVTVEGEAEVIVVEEVSVEEEVKKDLDVLKLHMSLINQQRQEVADHLPNSKKMMAIFLKKEKRTETNLSLEQALPMSLVETPQEAQITRTGKVEVELLKV
jgi:hypothetical protein